MAKSHVEASFREHDENIANVSDDNIDDHTPKDETKEDIGETITEREDLVKNY